MSENRMSETKLREQQELATKAAEGKNLSGHVVWKIVGGAALALAATGLLVSLKDIQRYIKISRM